MITDYYKDKINYIQYEDAFFKKWMPHGIYIHD